VSACGTAQLGAPLLRLLAPTLLNWQTGKRLVFGLLAGLSRVGSGVGLATAVLLDATIVRAVLLPASMKLLGEWSWYLPRALHRLPRAGLE
jgi:hypothetical protein